MKDLVGFVGCLTAFNAGGLAGNGDVFVGGILLVVGLALVAWVVHYDD